MGKTSAYDGGGVIPNQQATADAQRSQTEAMDRYIQFMGGSMTAAMQQMAQATAMAAIPKMAEISTPTEIDWTAAQNKLSSKLKATEALDAARKTGRSKTVLSSPLLDEEDAQTTRSILVGK